jgi:enoyl-CoA hydratase
MSVTLETIEPSITVLQVNRPGVRNALNWEAMQAFADCVEQAHALPDLRALIVSGAGDAFIAGGDLKELHTFPSYGDGQSLSRGMVLALERLEALPCPVIAAVNGPARGGGVEIALACDLRILSAEADLGLVQITLGLTPGWGAGNRLLRLVGFSRALEWLATGKVLSASEALAHGLANRVTPPGGALAGALELARTISAQSPQAVAAVKRLLRAALILVPETAAAFEQAEFPPLWASEEHRQAVERFLKRKAG